MPWNSQKTAAFNLKDNKQPSQASQCFLGTSPVEMKTRFCFSLQGFVLCGKQSPIVFINCYSKESQKQLFEGCFSCLPPQWEKRNGQIAATQDWREWVDGQGTECWITQQSSWL